MKADPSLFIQTYRSRIVQSQFIQGIGGVEEPVFI